MDRRLVRLSKTLSYALRHDPASLGLSLDAQGWVSLSALLAALNARGSERQVGEADLIHMMQESEKQRFEIRDGKIRAFYGHSVPLKVEKEPAVPPETLYHGTSPQAAQLIQRTGLKPMSRQYVHLSADKETALLVGRRRSNPPTLLKINALQAHDAGIVFYLGNDQVWLAEPIPPHFISIASS